MPGAVLNAFSAGLRTRVIRKSARKAENSWVSCSGEPSFIGFSPSTYGGIIFAIDANDVILPDKQSGFLQAWISSQ